MSVEEETLDNIEVEHFEGGEDDEKLQELLGKLMEGTQKAAKRQGQFIDIHPAVYFVSFVIIIGVIGLFSYKLVQSLKEKERKREEKRKLKELKKKK